MLSRVADNLYWMSRYLERAEHTARVMGVQLNLMLEQDPRTSSRRWLRTLGALGNSTPVAANQDPFAPAQIYALRQITGGIASARENARQVREQISSEMWEHMNRLYHEVRRMEAAGLWQSQPLDFLTVILESSHLVQGVTDSTMNHGEGWQFIQVGRFIERAAATARLLDIYFHEFPAGQAMDSGEHMEWIGLLRSCTAFEAYC
ncbi:MAG TPA: alpha-E domain-containing protein, partial [Bryobacteraceae bacterium]|nr:alpha-E domain-containing protein [Bryobacteraceae bacterium]